MLTHQFITKQIGLITPINYQTDKRLMALSETVKASLRDAQENLKDALACAARNEKIIR